MPTLLRFAIAAIAFVGLTASPLLLILVGQDRSDGPSTTLAVVALCALWTAPVLGGTLVSAWSASDADGRRRMRRAVAVCALVALAGAALLVATTPLTRSPLWSSLLLAFVALAAFPGALALGRTARRIEDRRDAPAAGDDEFEHVTEELRRGRRHGIAGAVVGLAVGVLIDVWLGTMADDAGSATGSLVAFPIALAVLGASVGRLTVVFRIARRTRELLGSDYTMARRVGRIIRGKAIAESPEEEARAARYARIAVRTIPYQSWSSLLTIVAIVTLQVPTALDDGVRPAQWFILGIAVVTVAGVLPLQAVQLRRIRAFADAHPDRLPVAG